jgi:hypothetical protein
MFPAATLSGCAYSSSDTLVSMSDNTASSIFIKEIAVKISAPDAPAELADVVRSRLRKELKKCATGDRPIRLDVTIAVFSGANPGRTSFIGHAIVIRGTARITDTYVKVLGDYDIVESLGAAGVGGAVVLTYGGNTVAASFARAVCKLGFDYSAQNLPQSTG